MAGSAMLIFGALGLPTALATKSSAQEPSAADSEEEPGADPDAADEEEARDDV